MPNTRPKTHQHTLHSRCAPSPCCMAPNTGRTPCSRWHTTTAAFCSVDTDTEWSTNTAKTAAAAPSGRSSEWWSPRQSSRRAELWCWATPEGRGDALSAVSSLWLRSWSAMALWSAADVRSGTSPLCCDTDTAARSCGASARTRRRLYGAVRSSREEKCEKIRVPCTIS